MRLKLCTEERKPYVLCFDPFARHSHGFVMRGSFDPPYTNSSVDMLLRPMLVDVGGILHNDAVHMIADLQQVFELLRQQQYITKFQSGLRSLFVRRLGFSSRWRGLLDDLSLHSTLLYIDSPSLEEQRCFDEKL